MGRFSLFSLNLRLGAWAGSDAELLAAHPGDAAIAAAVTALRAGATTADAGAGRVVVRTGVAYGVRI